MNTAAHPGRCGYSRPRVWSYLFSLIKSRHTYAETIESSLAAAVYIRRDSCCSTLVVVPRLHKKRHQYFVIFFTSGHPPSCSRRVVACAAHQCGKPSPAALLMLSALSSDCRAMPRWLLDLLLRQLLTTRSSSLHCRPAGSNPAANPTPFSCLHTFIIHKEVDFPAQ